VADRPEKRCSPNCRRVANIQNFPSRLFFGVANIPKTQPEYFPGAEYFLANNGRGIIQPRPNINIPDELDPPIDPGTLLQPDNLCPTSGGGLVEHGDPAHAGPPAQVPTAWRDDRPAARRRTTGREHRFVDRIRTAHNLILLRGQSHAIGDRRGRGAAAGVRRGSRAQRTDKRPTLIDIGKPDSCTYYVLLSNFLYILYFSVRCARRALKSIYSRHLTPAHTRRQCAQAVRKNSYNSRHAGP